MTVQLTQEELHVDPDRLRDALAMMRRNNDFFQAHAEELFEKYPDGWILIFGDQQVETFDDILEAAARRTSLPPSERDGSLLRRQMSGIWIL